MNDAYGIGDVILVKMKVKEIGEFQLTAHPLACENDPSQHIKVDADDINSIFTAAIKVGDRVRVSGSYAVVLAINEQQAWVRYENGRYETALLKNLKRSRMQYKEASTEKAEFEYVRPEPVSPVFDLQEVQRRYHQLEDGIALRPPGWGNGCIYASNGRLYIQQPFKGKKAPLAAKRNFTLEEVHKLMSEYRNNFSTVSDFDDDDD